MNVSAVVGAPLRLGLYKQKFGTTEFVFLFSLICLFVLATFTFSVHFFIGRPPRRSLFWRHKRKGRLLGHPTVACILYNTVKHDTKIPNCLATGSSLLGIADKRAGPEVCSYSGCTGMNCGLHCPSLLSCTHAVCPCRAHQRDFQSLDFRKG